MIDTAEASRRSTSFSVNAVFPEAVPPATPIMNGLLFAAKAVASEVNNSATKIIKRDKLFLLSLASLRRRKA